MKDNMRNGKGRMIHADGDVYDGDWVNGESEGQGCHTSMDGTQYKGQWKKGEELGFGGVTYPVRYL